MSTGQAATRRHKRVFFVSPLRGLTNISRSTVGSRPRLRYPTASRLKPLKFAISEMGGVGRYSSALAAFVRFRNCPPRLTTQLTHGGRCPPYELQRLVIPPAQRRHLRDCCSTLLLCTNVAPRREGQPKVRHGRFAKLLDVRRHRAGQTDEATSQVKIRQKTAIRGPRHLQAQPSRRSGVCRQARQTCGNSPSSHGG